MNKPVLELTLTASTAGFIQSLAQGDAAVSKAMTDMQSSVNRFAGVLDGLQNKARSSAAVFQEFDAAQAQFRALQSQLDPAARALHQFEAAQ